MSTRPLAPRARGWRALAAVTAVGTWVAFAAGCADEVRPIRVLDVEALTDPATCQQCHAEQYAQWSGSMHAYAAEDPVFRAMNARGQRESQGALGSFCVNCHAPDALAAWY